MAAWMTMTTFVLLCCSCLALLSPLAVAQKRSVQDELFSFGEDQLANSRIGPGNVYDALMRVEKLRNSFASVSRRSLRFEVIKNEPIGRFFRIDNDSALFLTEQVDRDDLCRGYQQCCNDEKNCIMNLIVSVAHADNERERELFTVRIEVQDKDDNSPSFGRDFHSVEVREDAAVGSKIALLAARDLDTTANGIARYSLRNHTDTFSVHYPSVNSVFLNLLKPLDREHQERYSLLLVAEGRNSQRTGELRIEVLVRDANDHHPVFLNRSYSAKVPEDFALGTEILRVEAVDRDEGENGRVFYDLDLCSDQQKSLFEIDSDSGVIYLKSPLDYEVDEVHVLRVQAKDGGNHPTVAEASVTVQVSDVNDCAPEIQLEAAYDSTVEVLEGRERQLPIGLTFAIVRDQDRTNSTNGNFSCWLNDTRFKLVQYAETRTLFKLNLTSPLDRERSAQEHVAITCADRGSPPLSSEKVLTVLVKDVNDNEPRFSQSLYDVYVRESSEDFNQSSLAPALHIFTLNASDADDSSELHFSLDAEGSKYLTVDDHGRLFTRPSVRFDRESVQRYSFSVRVVDDSQQAARRFSSSSSVVLHILDVNDNSPKFQRQLYTFRKTENQHGYLGTVKASDADSFSDPNGLKVEYRLADDDALSHLFDLRPNGELHARVNLDREIRATYNFTVLAVDFGDPNYGNVRRTATATVLLQLDDVNDNAPRILWPSPSNNSLRLSYRTARNTPVARILANDSDEHGHSALQYSVLHDSHLLLADERGTLRVARELSASDLGQFVLTISVSDSSASTGPVHTATALLYVTVDESSAQAAYWAELGEEASNGQAPWYDGVLNSHSKAQNAGEQALLHLLVTVMLAVLFLILVLICIVVIVRRVRSEQKNDELRKRAHQQATQQYSHFGSNLDRCLASLLCVKHRKQVDQLPAGKQDSVHECEEQLAEQHSDEDRTYATLDSTVAEKSKQNDCRSLQRLSSKQPDSVHLYDECANNAYLDYTLNSACHSRPPLVLQPMAYCGTAQGLCSPCPQYYSTYLPGSSVPSGTNPHRLMLLHQQNAHTVGLGMHRPTKKESLYVHKPMPVRARSAQSSAYDDELNNNNNNNNSSSRARLPSHCTRTDSGDGDDHEIEQVLACAADSRGHTVVSCSPQFSTVTSNAHSHKQLAAVVKGSYV